jgi:hypothetical protein
MTWRPDIIQVVVANNLGGGKNGTPRAVFIIGEIDGFSGLQDSGSFVNPIQLGAGHVSWTAELPRVDHVTNHLPLVGITRTGVNLDSSILVSDSAGAPQAGNKNLPPKRLVTARNKLVVVVRVHHHGQAHLLEIVVATGLLRLLFGFAQRRQKHSREDGDDRDDNEQLDQGESDASVVICSDRHNLV